MSSSHNWLGSFFFKCLDFIDVIRGWLHGNNASSGDGDLDPDDMSAPKIDAAYEKALSDTYERLKASFPRVGPLESGRCEEGADAGSWILDFDGLAAIVGTSLEPFVFFEVHGGIYGAWKESGKILGPLGRPVSDEADYHGPDARPGDRCSEFEKGVIVWRADTCKTELRMK